MDGQKCSALKAAACKASQSLAEELLGIPRRAPARAHFITVGTAEATTKSRLGTRSRPARRASPHALPVL